KSQTVSLCSPYYGIIVDVVHPSSVRIAAILVTDAISPAGIDLYDPQHLLQAGHSSPLLKRKRGKGFWLGKLRVLLRNHNKEVVIEGTETLAGRIDKFTGCSLAEAINAATVAPASVLGILGKKGSLDPGADADFVV
ncbi:hypothetical protein BC829DRAFT_388416, partial [Chytridium lagenaria]